MVVINFPNVYSSDECDGDTSKEYNAKLGRCVSKQNSIETNNAYQKCTEITDNNTRTRCLKDLAKSEVGKYGKAEQAGPGDIAGASVNVIFSGAIGVSALFKGEEGTITNCYGKMIAIGTGTVGVLAQQYFVYSSKKELDEIQKKFEDASNEDDYQTQLNAFQYLKEEQEAIVSLAETRRNSYYVLSAGYALAAATSLLSDSSTPQCTKTEAEVDTKKQKSPIPESTTKVDKAVLKADKKLIDEAGGAAKQSYGTMIDSPTGVALISSAAAGWNLYLAGAASDQAKKAKENVEAIDKIIVKFKDTVAGSCPNGRENYTEGRCYCYNSDGTQNTAHSNSGTCKNLWANDNKNLFAKSTDKTFTGEKKDQKGCLTLDQQFDEKCKCKKFIDDEGKNACYKSGFSGIASAGLDSGLSNSPILDNLDKISGANTNDFNLSSEQVNKLAKSTNAQLKNILKKLGADRPNNSFSSSPINNDLFKNMAKKIARKSPSLMSNLKQNKTFAGSSNPKSSTFLSKTIKKARKSLKVSSFTSSGNGLTGQSKKGKFRFQFDRGSNSNSGKVKNYPLNKKYNYKNNDIVMRKDLSLWKVISNRYTNSGLRRLFSK